MRLLSSDLFYWKFCMGPFVKRGQVGLPPVVSAGLFKMDKLVDRTLWWNPCSFVQCMFHFPSCQFWLSPVEVTYCNLNPQYRFHQSCLNTNCTHTLLKNSQLKTVASFQFLLLWLRLLSKELVCLFCGRIR